MGVLNHGINSGKILVWEMSHCCPGDQHKTFLTTVHAEHQTALILVCTLELAIFLPSVFGPQGETLFSEGLSV